MTLDTLKTGAPYVTTGAAVVFAALLVHQCNRADTAEAKLERVEVAAKLADAGVPPLAESDTKGLRAALEDERQRSKAFAASLDEMNATLAWLKLKAKPVEVVKWRTKEAVAFGPPLPPSTAPVPNCPPEPACLVRPDTKLAIEGHEGRLETKDGNLLAIGDASILRDGVAIFDQPIDLKLTSGVADREPDLPVERPWIGGIAGTIDKDAKWGVGPLIGYSRSRIGGSVALTFPNRTGVANLFARF